jgi:hypothetical protein
MVAASLSNMLPPVGPKAHAISLRAKTLPHAMAALLLPTLMISATAALLVLTASPCRRAAPIPSTSVKTTKHPAASSAPVAPLSTVPTFHGRTSAGYLSHTTSHRCTSAGRRAADLMAQTTLCGRSAAIMRLRACTTRTSGTIQSDTVHLIDRRRARGMGQTVEQRARAAGWDTGVPKTRMPTRGTAGAGMQAGPRTVRDPCHHTWTGTCPLALVTGGVRIGSLVGLSRNGSHMYAHMISTNGTHVLVGIHGSILFLAGGPFPPSLSVPVYMVQPVSNEYIPTSC